MKGPVWITREVVLATQEGLLSRFGGLPGLRDSGLLDSTLRRPQQLLSYGTPAVFALAAAYASAIIRNHPFLDGNKRIGFMTAYIFLGVDGLAIEAPEEGVVVQTLALAAGEIDEPAYARWLQAAVARA